MSKVERVGDVWRDYTEKDSFVQVGTAFVSEQGAKEIAVGVAEALHSISIQVLPCIVERVLYDDEDLKEHSMEGNYKYIGACSVKAPIGFELPSDWVLPSNPHNKDLPIVGEAVAVINLGEQSYYTNQVNFDGNVNNNAKFGAVDPGGEKLEVDVSDSNLENIQQGFIPTAFPRPVRTQAGDYIIEGRYDQSIRIGRNFSRSEKEKKDSVLKFRIAKAEDDPKNYMRPKEEDIQDDHASIYMIKNEKINLVPARTIPNVSKRTGETITPSSIGGDGKPQIMIDSDRLIFNTKAGVRNDISIFGGADINIVSNGDTNLAGKRINLGDIDRIGTDLERAVLGESLVELLYYMAIELSKVGANFAGAVGIGNIGAPTPLPQVQGEGARLAAVFGPGGRFSLQAMKTAFLSNNVYIARNVTGSESV